MACSLTKVLVFDTLLLLLLLLSLLPVRVEINQQGQLSLYFASASWSFCPSLLISAGPIHSENFSDALRFGHEVGIESQYESRSIDKIAS